MANINQLISLGIGTPADVPHFLLVGLSPAGGGATAHPDGAGCTAGAGQCTAIGSGGFSGGWTGGDATPGYERGRSEGWITRDYVRKPLPKRITRVRGHAQPRGAGAVTGAGVALAVGVRRAPSIARPWGAGCELGAGLCRVIVPAVARVRVKPQASEEWWLLGLAMGEDR